MDDYKRRTFLKCSALGFATIALNLKAVSIYAQKANASYGKWDSSTELNWDAFLEKISALAKTQYDPVWDQKAYTQSVKQLLLQCNFPEFENIKTEMESYQNKRENWFESSSLHYETDFQISLFQFEKGEYIPHHDHPEMTGVLNVVSGQLLTKNYSIEQHLDDTREIINGEESHTMKKCILKEVGNEILSAGDVGILTADEGNIHSIMPNSFSQMVDIFTPAYKYDTNAHWYDVNEEENYQGKEHLFEAEFKIN